ncbi:hypothetical protein [Methylobacterium trifolii]|nr:hypothetical protein [Methylobacterium trifolii]
MRTFLRLSVWIIAAVLVFVTLSPIGLRPAVAPADLERAVAYAGFGLLVVLAYPRQWWLGLAAAVLLAGALEYGQGLTASRHGRLADFLVKAGAAAAGALFAHALVTAAARIGGPQPRPLDRP